MLDNPRTTVYNKDKERRYPCKRLAPHQFKSLQKVMTATGLGVLGGHFFLCFFLCILVLDNPRTAVYNKVKERRYPCKRLAPHQSSITKVMTATELGNCGRSFLFVLFPFAAIRIILFPVVHQMYNTYDKCQQCDDRLEKQ